MRAITVTESTEKFTMDAMRQLQPQVLIPAQVPISDLKVNPQHENTFENKSYICSWNHKGQQSLNELF